MRENVVMDKMQFDVAGDEWRDVLKERIMAQIEKYFIIIIFSLYCRETGPNGFSPSFSSWLAATSYQEQIDAGKSRLEWERKVSEDQISALKELMNSDNFDENLPAVSTRLISCPTKCSLIIQEVTRSVNL